MSDNSVVVAISMITYNQEKYIAQAIEGVLMQKTEFNYKLYITNDCSPDDTALICKKYAREYPDLIDFEDFSANKGMLGNWNYNLNKCKNSNANYIAICEGDDYWTDPLKLQKQVDFLNKHVHVNIVHTDFDWYDENSKNKIKNYYKSSNYVLPITYSIGHFFLNSKMRTLTFCFRTSEIVGFDKILEGKNWSVGDTALLLYVVKNKKIGFIDCSTGVYRRGVNTTSAKVNPQKQFIYWQNASHKVKMFFYNYYHINDRKIKKHLTNEYYDNMYNVAVPARKHKYIIKSFIYKLFNLRLTKSNIGYLTYSILGKI